MSVLLTPLVIGFATGVGAASASPLFTRLNRAFTHLAGVAPEQPELGRVDRGVLADVKSIAETVTKGVVRGAAVAVAPEAAIAMNAAPMLAQQAPSQSFAAPQSFAPAQARRMECQCVGGADPCKCHEHQEGVGAGPFWPGNFEGRKTRKQLEADAKRAKAEIGQLKEAEAKRAAEERFKQVEANLRAEMAQQVDAMRREETAKRLRALDRMRIAVSRSADKAREVASAPPEWLKDVLESIAKSKESANPAAAPVAAFPPPPPWIWPYGAPPAPAWGAPYGAPPPYASPYGAPAPYQAFPTAPMGPQYPQGPAFAPDPFQGAAMAAPEIDPFQAADLFAYAAVGPIAGLEADQEEGAGWDLTVAAGWDDDETAGLEANDDETAGLEANNDEAAGWDDATDDTAPVGCGPTGCSWR